MDNDGVARRRQEISARVAVGGGVGQINSVRRHGRRIARWVGDTGTIADGVIAIGRRAAIRVSGRRQTIVRIAQTLILRLGLKVGGQVLDQVEQMENCLPCTFKV